MVQPALGEQKSPQSRSPYHIHRGYLKAIRQPNTSQYENAEEMLRLTQSDEAYVQPTSSTQPSSYFDVNSFLRRTLGSFTASSAVRSTDMPEEQSFMTSPSKKRLYVHFKASIPF